MSAPPRRDRAWRVRQALASGAVLGLAVLVCVVAHWLRPSVQRAFVLERVAPRFEVFAVDHLRVTPWSAEVRGLRLEQDGALLQLGSLRVGFNPFGLLAHTVDLSRLEVVGAVADLRGLPPAAPATTPFAGVLHILEQGYALALDELDARIALRLAGDRVLDLVLGGGDLAPVERGTLTFSLRGVHPQLPLVRGKVRITQLNRGRVRELRAAVDTTVERDAGAGLPLAARVVVTPAERRRARARPAPDAPPPPPRPERVAARLVVGEQAGAALDISGVYRGADGSFQADYTAAFDLDALAPLLDTSTLPAVSGDLRGRLELATLAGTGEISLEGIVDALELARALGEAELQPGALQLTTSARGHFDAARFTLDSVTLGLADDASIERLQVASAGAVDIPYGEPLALLATPRELAEIALGPLPLAWFEGLAGGRSLAGELDGEFVLLVDAEQRFRFEPRHTAHLRGLAVGIEVPADDGSVPAADTATASTAPPTPAVATTEATTEATTAPGDGLVVEPLDVEVRPTASWSPDFLRYALNDLTVSRGDTVVGVLQFKAAQRQGGETPADWRYRLAGLVDYDALRDVAAVRRHVDAYPLPAGLSLNFTALVAQGARALTVEKADVVVGETQYPEVLRVTGAKPFHFARRGDQWRPTNADGVLATVSTRGLDLAWLNAFVPGLDLAGRLASADFELSAPAADALSLTPRAPLTAHGIALGWQGAPLLAGLAASLSPRFDYRPGMVAATLDGIDLRSGRGRLLGGAASWRLEQAGGAPDAAAVEAPASRVTVSGELELDIRHAARQPLVAARLAEPLPDVPVSLDGRFALDLAAGTLHAQRLEADLAVGERARAELVAEPGLQLRTDYRAGDDLAQAFVGALALDVRDLSSATLGEFVGLEGVAFDDIDTRLRVRSDGRVLRANTLEPVGVAGARVDGEDGPKLREFSLLSEASLRAEGRRLRVSLADLALRFAAAPAVPAVAGRIKAEIEPGRAAPLTELDAALTADLPQVLAQPALLPGHGLSAGTVAVEVAVSPDRALNGHARLAGLTATKPLAVNAFDIPVQGTLAADGRGFDFTAPVTGQGKSGVSAVAVTGHYAPQPDEPRVLQLELASKLFYLNDILATMAAISPGPPGKGADGKSKTVSAKRSAQRPDRTPDPRAAWKVIPWAVVIDLAVDKLFYSDYLAFDDVGAHLDLRTHRFKLEGVRARFHDSSLAVDGALRYSDGATEPYSLALDGTLEKFDLNQFFTELVPGEKPRVEGLFGGKLSAFGDFPNFDQLRNDVDFDLRLESRDGLFRPLPPSSGLLASTSDLLGIVGEGLSYVPTGGFGAGAVARLVDYIARIDYDTIDIHVVRDDRRDVVVEQFQVLSPTIALIATGGITYEEGKDILDSPLALDASLDMLGRGAAILYSMDLMGEARNDLGYWEGPKFRIWGTPAEPQSNFEDIIAQAGDGTLKGAVTRPIAGLVGNLKYLWFDGDSRAREREQAERREIAEEAAALEGAAAVSVPENEGTAASKDAAGAAAPAVP